MKFIGKFLLLCAATVAVATSTSYGQTNSQQSEAKPAQAQPTIKFDVVSLKPCEDLDWHGKVTDYIAIRCQPITRLVNFAFSDLGPYQLKNEPEWVDTEPYDCLAKIAPADIATWQKMTLGSKRLMVRIMLADALNLKMHIEQQPRPIYALVVAKDGPKLTEHKPGPDDPPPGSITLVHAGAHWVSPDEVAYTNASMRDLVSGLSARLDRNVVDQTGLTGRYDFNVKPLPYPHYDPKSVNVEDTDFAGIIDGVKSLGLRLEPTKADSSVIVIDHIDRPPTN
jgi:uncharacterized protein (TIGR03435 family)